MTIEEQLKEIILEQYKSIRAFTQAFNIPYSTLNSVFKRGISNSGIGTVIKIFDALDLDTESIKENSLKKREQVPSNQNEKGTFVSLSFNENNIINKYRALDEHGKKMVNIVIIEETARVEKEQLAQVQYTEPEKVIKLPNPIQAASAGYGEFIDDETVEWVVIKYNDMTKKADYVMRVNGDSMEPKFLDGQQVLIHQQPAVEPGEIGIFIKEGERFIKIYRGDHLESANPDYPDVPLEEYSRCVGKVLGVLEEDWIVE